MNNIPFITIILAMVGSIVTLLMGKREKAAYALMCTIFAAVAVLSFLLIPHFMQSGGTITYILGHFGSPLGNELRFGLLESVLACVFSTVMLLAVIGGKIGMKDDVQSWKRSGYFSLLLLVLLSLLVLIFTNDIFTGYVFIEINTLSACGIVMVKESGETLKATIKYLFMSLMASGLFLISVAILYAITGQLLIPPLAEEIGNLVASGNYHWPLMVAGVLITVSLGVKSAMFPFHTWLPDAHGTATTASSSILSGVVVKGYIILLVKIFYRVFGIENVKTLGLLNIVFALGIAGMIFGSIMAIREKNLKRMIAYSSVAQIGYIYAGIGVGLPAALAAAFFHMIVHAFTKPLLFTSAGGLIEVSQHSKQIADMTGAGLRHKWAGIGFAVGSCSMVGVPLFAGFTSKIFLAVNAGERAWIFLLALALSSFLNAIYYMPVCLRIFKKEQTAADSGFDTAQGAGTSLSIACFTVINIALGIGGYLLFKLLTSGVSVL